MRKIHRDELPIRPDDPATHREERASDAEALVLDRYLDSLLSGDHRSASADQDGNAPGPAIRETADLVRRSFVRVHPSFGFEERLSTRLAAMAAGPDEVPGLGTLIPFRPSRPKRPGPSNAERENAGAAGRQRIGDPQATPVVAGTARRSPAVRPLLIGGAITSAALSVAGVAWVARRVVRAPALAELEGVL